LRDERDGVVPSSFTTPPVAQKRVSATPSRNAVA
jgi:hypothetical protein